jgi:prepilin-type N-terminal cleavage/methylation domain-containing protein
MKTRREESCAFTLIELLGVIAIIAILGALLNIMLPLHFSVPRAAGAGPVGAGRQRLLYVVTPRIRDYLENSGHGVLVFDIDHRHRFVKRIAFPGVDEKGKPLNVKGIAVHATTKRLYVA